MRRAQGAIEYLFMIAAALIIIAVVIKYLRSTGETAGKQANETVSEVSKQIAQAINQSVNESLKE
ncbi:class III signal peptide-containing protein [Pyrococcus kukulkanii]|uniref:Class III signal peptide-containing protein n=1 Tax=Pyrococcus kukulkanii TaxID=1609559 RepID=A0ABV4T9R4_9EURY